jgi:hypothetical protein
MAGKAGTLETLARQIGIALQPLETELTPGNLIPFLSELGLQLPAALLAEPAFMNAINAAATAAGGLAGLLTQLETDIAGENEAAMVQDGLQLVSKIRQTVTALESIGTELKSIAGSLAGMDAAEVTAFAENLASALLGYLLVFYLDQVLPTVTGIGNLMGVLDNIPNPGIPGDPTHPQFVSRKLRLSNLGTMFTNPTSLLKTIYGWGDPGFDGTLMMPRLAASLNLLGIPATVNLPGPGNLLNSSMFSLQPNPATSPPGLLATLSYDLSTEMDLTLPITATLSMRAQAKGSFKPGLTATITPPANVVIKPLAELSGKLQMDLIAAGADASHPIILFGQTAGSRLQTDSFTFGAGVTFNWDVGSGTATAEPHVTAQVTGGKAVIDTTQADGFLATVLSGVHVEAGFNFKLTWAPDTGIHFEGGAQLEIDLPLHLNLGPVTLPTLYLIAGASSSGIPLEISAALGITLGPISASVDRVGVRGLLSFPNHGGNLGPADLSLKFKPPSGLGIAIDAGVIAGGGFISFDPDKGQYAGVLDAALFDVVQIKIIGVLDTIMPDGSKGYAFLLILTFDFPPIQLSFGFTLNGVGGLVGVNRTMSKDALHAGFRAHSLNSVLFPNDPI